jgi:pyruvate/2-oxoglutarate dehydrogenase complex dihydrolipoamide acyltransferase (E2) component
MNRLRKKLIMATWRPPSEGIITGKLTVDATNALSYIEGLRSSSGEKVTITHFVARAVGQAIHNTPSINGFIRWGRFHQHETVSLSMLVALEGGNIANTRIADIQKKSVADVCSEVRLSVEKLRTNKDDDFKSSQSSLRWMPVWLMRPVLWLTGLVTSSFGWSVPMFGLKAFPFGSCMITSVGMFGLDEGYAPHTPFARVPMLALIGAIRDQAVVIDKEIQIRPMLTITATIDHRYIDGAQAANIAGTVREAFEKPWVLDGHQSNPFSATEAL